MKEGSTYVLAAAVFYGFIAAGCRFFADSGLSLYEITIYTFLCGSILLLPILIKKKYLPQKNMLSFFLIYGLISALLQLSSFGAIVLGVPIAAAVLLLYTEPLWTILFAKPLLGEPLTERKMFAVSVSLLGVLIVTGTEILSGLNLTGVILALLSGVFLSLWVIYSRESDLKKQHYSTTTFSSMAFALPWFLLSYPITYLLTSNQKLVGFASNLPIEIWLFLCLYVAFAYIIPNYLFDRGLNMLSASRACVIMPLEPITATVLAAVFFQQPITANLVVGGVLILAANKLMSDGVCQ
jgi:drug/metabolite transporter (DMT)-like permease